ncbi:Homoserine dehydrogenase [Streptococcus thermophilus]|uniref:homoserine dehydrogenase n=1 Tax=Streptococcus thermophilus TaxID=1308 RepID=UPI0015C28296|nr:homoserine dehydrogenase [Streptococcus thermophilus]CAD0148260.1 Homoserine dehydrogenase [Streptococcus thermophilus]CAD0149437.1 Homoserine dehydrogenase [Streptococcus thermophilus]
MSIKIGLLGFGTVASGIPFLLKENGEKVFAASRDQLEIAKVLVKDDEEKNRLIAAGNDYNFVTNVDEILNDEEIQIVVELMGRIEPARTFITKALEAGKSVVSANKDLIATHGKELIALAEDKGVAFYYEAAVAGGIPILRTLANSLTSDKVTRILGVLNGTSNFMMTKMVDEGWSYEDALKAAQELGYAESDPTNDVEGYDAAYKAVILSQFGFGATIDFDDVSHKGITNISADDVAVAQELGYVIKLVGDVREVESGISAEVSPTFLPKNHPLASVNDVMNAVFVESIGIGESMYYGPGAGQKPTATSVLADIIRIARRLSDGNVGEPFNEFRRNLPLANPADVKSNYYFALDTPDEKGKILHLSEIFNSEDISFEQVLQQKANGTTARIVVITHAMSKTQLKAVTEKLEAAEDFTVVNTLKVLSN